MWRRRRGEEEFRPRQSFQGRDFCPTSVGSFALRPRKKVEPACPSARPLTRSSLPTCSTSSARRSSSTRRAEDDRFSVVSRETFEAAGVMSVGIRGALSRFFFPFLTCPLPPSDLYSSVRVRRKR